MRGIKAAALVAAVFLFISTPAAAHEETSLDALSVLDDVQPDLPGISFRVAQITQPALVATNRTDDPLVILGDQGEPFMRLYRGRVESNLRSALSYISTDPTGQHSVPPTGLNPTKAPRWQLLGRRRTWSWFDPRIRFSEGGQHRWKIEARLGRISIELAGEFEPLEGHGHFTTSLAGPSLDEQGLEIRLIDGLVPAIYVRNDSGRELVVTARHGEPFLRIGPKGVFGNTRSPDYWLGGTQTVRDIPPFADPAASPVWKKVSRVPIWSWLEFRARLPESVHQRSTLGPTRRTILQWTTPMKLGTTPLPVRGRVEWIPPQALAAQAEEGLDLTWLALLGAIAVAGGGALLARKIRPSRS